MFHKFYPDIYVDSAYQIDYDSLYHDGYRGLIFDIDNTLVTHGAPADDRAKKLFANLKEIGFECCLLSNNKEPRVKMFNDDVQVHYICEAHKPSAENYEKAMELMHTDKETTVFIGDQIFTDIFGANRTGIPSIMVKYIYWKEEIQIVFKRRLEAIVLLCYRRYRRKHKTAARGAFFGSAEQSVVS
ncbi:MAG: YqeG family HAD IIIA-type phosphatase [Clostridiales bacterium]|nr:YqeG family HAD IIIA-type phosphatase [Clostridiales bacterium]